MRLSSLSPLIFAATIAVAGVAAVVAPAHAASTAPVSDVGYLALARCAGISEGLGGDASAFDKALQSADGGRESFILDRAATERSDAAREARHAGPDTKAHMTAERDGVCKAMLS